MDKQRLSNGSFDDLPDAEVRSLRPGVDASDEPTRTTEIAASNSIKNLSLRFWITLLIVLVSFGCYAQYLNQIHYDLRAPFYDSMSYNDRLFEVVSIRRESGLQAAVENACLKRSTVCLPYLLAIPFSYLMEPTRAIGVWIEVGYLGVFVFSLAWFLHRVRGARGWDLLVALVPVFLFGGLYRSTAGIADFRVDLPMGFLYGASACWMLLGMRDGRWADFFVAGALIGAACLSRAIAPVYFFCGWAPLLFVAFLRTSDRRKLCSQILFVFITATIFAGWFYLKHFEHLYYYYFVWNTDANADVPLLRSLKHFSSAAKSIGPFVAVFFLSLFMVRRTIQEPVENETNDNDTPGENNIEPPRAVISSFAAFGWLGIAPILMLIAKRADINPFVSLPAALGILTCWILFQFRNLQLVTYFRPLRIGLTCGTCLLLALAYGYVNHAKVHFPQSAEAHRNVLDVIRQDAIRADLKQVRISVSVTTNLSPDSLKSMLQFEGHSKYVNRVTVENEGIRFNLDNSFFLPAKVNWVQAAGESDGEKIALLVEKASQGCDYVVSPTVDSFSTIESRYANVYASRFADALMQRFANSPQWQPISDEIEAEPGVKLVVLKNIGVQRQTQRQKLPRVR